MQAFREWDDLLSAGERQRLAFARLLYHRPAFALLDEATTFVDVDSEARLLGLCQGAGISLVTVAHRPSVRRFHDVQLVIKGDGSGGFEVVRLADGKDGDEAT